MIGVVTHTSRLDHASALADVVGASVVNVDNGSLGCDRNHRRVWQWLFQRADEWAIVLEDDAVPVPNFRTQLAQALKHAPTPLVSLYLGRMRPPWAQDHILTAVANAGDADWIVSNHMLHAVGYAVRVDLLPSLMSQPLNTPVDQHISAWAQTESIDISYPWPSLIDHADLPTIVDHPDGQPRPPGRVAWKTAAHPTWSQRSVTMRI